MINKQGGDEGMSYSLKDKCFDCRKGGKEYKSSCIDKIILANAIGTIHNIGNMRGHLGAGSIVLDCVNFEKKEMVG